ncbi:ATP-binding protein [Nocardioides KLBMP 9356]|uniref:ATP-binding protein n=1 Tax=Nocardioides potassii TaxID=2911371 RepID=A0ABS9HCY0_9ACTN|nr:ATP-binding protein [Nocardioides potassii]MCF6378162.1 ATP-binding protein [Nocardioides potassii]
MSRELEMSFAGSLVKHLGLQMYSGAVPALAELVSNAWDADATRVSLTIPLDTPIGPDAEIVVRDDGEGMSFSEVRDKYLLLGRDRREADGDRTRQSNRPVLGRKGIGKLAGFGIARVVEVWTVKDGHLTAFRMNYDDITAARSAVAAYRPEVLHDRAVTDEDPLSGGTMIRLSRIQLKNRVGRERFLRGLSRRFSLLSANFVVEVNGEELTREDMPLQFRFPESGYEVADVPGLGTVQWWAGFTERPIQVEEARGISVLARGKIAQSPFFFELAGGAQSQLGLQYLTGEVFADGLDSDEADLIATDRASVLWEHPVAEPLLEWGQAKVRQLLRDWSRLRQERQVERLRGSTPYMSMVEKFPAREKRELLSAIDTLSRIETIENERLDEIVKILIQAYENDHFLNVIRALRDIEASAQDEIVKIIEEWDVIEAVQTAQLVRGRVEIIKTFEAMIAERVPEKPDMQDFLKSHPWLIDPAWQMMAHERSLENVLEDHFNKKKQRKKRGGRRLDFLCLADSSHAVVVEVKRPGDRAGVTELRQLEDYLMYLRRRNDEVTGGRSKRHRISGVLIHSRMDEDGRELAERLAKGGDAIIVTWDSLLETARRLHGEFFDLMVSRAPSDDPRVEALLGLEDEPDAGSKQGDAERWDAEPAGGEGEGPAEAPPAES